IKDDKTKVVDQKIINNSQKISYRQFPGGNYSVRVVYDDNNNNKWDTGNLATKTQPEQLWYWDKIITIRPNWEQEEIVKIPTKTSVIEAQPEQKKDPEIEETQEVQESNNAMEEPYIKSGTITPRGAPRDTTNKTDTTVKDNPVRDGEAPTDTPRQSPEDN